MEGAMPSVPCKGGMQTIEIPAGIQGGDIFGCPN